MTATHISQPDRSPMPEATNQSDERASAQVANSTVYVLNNQRRPSNRWWANVQPGHGDDDERITQEECEAIARRIAAALTQAPSDTGAQPLVRFCPGCGSVGPVEAKWHDCCPDGNEARMIPAKLAEKCRDTFQLAIRNIAAPPPVTEAQPAAGALLTTSAEVVLQLIINHWNEFGPEHGFGDLMDRVQVWSKHHG